jgi:prepilin-type N-terminal cleavage/methylation domain-containing protein
MTESGVKKIKFKEVAKIPAPKSGFSLIECVIALLVLLAASLAVVSVFDYSLRSRESARKRFAALLLAEQRIDDTRNILFNNLTAGTTTEPSVYSDGTQFSVVRTVVDTDVLVVSTAPGPETKLITVVVTPTVSTMPNEAVTLITSRSKNSPGPNREENAP